MRLLCIAGLIFMGWTAAVPSQAPSDPVRGEAMSELAPEMKQRLLASCFEVVVPRPEKSTLSYEKELPWDRIPFHIRNDKYYSIGTAFSVSPTELVTAFHVLELSQDLLSYPRYYIRDSQRNVYEIDKILLAHESRDVVRFTVRGRTFDQWLDLESRHEMNRPVYTAGNALGEGIVVRRGDLVGTLQEPMDGAWSWLKSSAEVNSGNSGGPLLNGNGKVIGIVVQRKDNLSYSLPVSEYLALKPATAGYYNKVTYGFSLFPETSSMKTSAFEIPLPLGYRELKLQAYAKRHATYERDMGALFAEQKELFPSGASSLEVVYDIPTSGFPEVIFKDGNSNRWAITELKANSFKLGNNGNLKVASASGLTLLKIRKPDDVAYADLVEKPKVAMDLVFKGLNVPREFGGEKVRITSLGDPFRVLEHQDRFGRPWRFAVWHMEFSDTAVLLCSTPTPGGMVMVLQEAPSPKTETWIYDLKKVVDFLFVPYESQLKNWGPFLALPKNRLPGVFQNLRMEFEPGKSLRFRSPWVDLDLDRRTQTLSSEDWLGLFMGFTQQGGPGGWELRRVTYNEDEGDNYFVWIQHLRPLPGMEESHAKKWKELVQERHPYTREAFSKESRTDIGMVLPAFVPKGSTPEASPRLGTLYLGRTGSVPDSTMKALLGDLSAGIKPSSSRPPASTSGHQP